MVNVKRCILYSFGDDWTSELLPSDHESQPLLTLIGKHMRRIRNQQHLPHEIETRGTQIYCPAAGRRYRLFDVSGGVRRQVHVSNVSPIDGKAGRHFDQSIDQLLTVQLSRLPNVTRAR